VDNLLFAVVNKDASPKGAPEVVDNTMPIMYIIIDGTKAI